MLAHSLILDIYKDGWRNIYIGELRETVLCICLATFMCHLITWKQEEWVPNPDISGQHVLAVKFLYKILDKHFLYTNFHPKYLVFNFLIFGMLEISFGMPAIPRIQLSALWNRNGFNLRITVPANQFKVFQVIQTVRSQSPFFWRGNVFAQSMRLRSDLGIIFHVPVG